MRFRLEPLVGVAGLRFGMSREQAGVALKPLGNPQAFSRAGGPIGWSVHRPATTFVYFDDGGLLEAIEFSNPCRGCVADDSVMLADVDLFGSPADEVLAALVDQGLDAATEEDRYSTTFPGLALGLWRHGDPYGPDGLPVYFESALLALPGYYSQA